MDGHGLGQAKTKRARTSFKHHQLRIMKAHFQINQNPDSRELKMLSQKTGLDKKVLQVSYRDRFFCPVTPFVSHTSRQYTIVWHHYLGTVSQGRSCLQCANHWIKHSFIAFETSH